MLVEIKNIKQSLTDDEDSIIRLAAKRLNINPEEIKSLRVLKRSIDARKKDNIFFLYSVAVDISEKINLEKLKNDKDIDLHEEAKLPELKYGSREIIGRPIIIGSGPSGLFAALLLAEHGYKPLILERGRDVDSRSRDISVFFSGGEFDEDSNIQFGEGGAGTFSDGKLTTRIKDGRCDLVLSRFIEAGAPAEIAYINKPHIGTDILKVVIKNIREKIISLGGEIRFSAKATDILIEQGIAKAVVVNGQESIESNIIVAALGHSARDTYKMLYNKGIKMVPKPFSIGVRIEHKQSMLDEAQYGKFAGHPRLGAADYMLTTKSNTTGRSAYSFCMCPGGMVVAAASEREMLVTNGMSEYKRDRENANSALVVSVSPEDFESLHPLAGIAFQRTWEGKAYQLGGGNYHAPIQLVGDFLRGKASTSLGRIKPSYEPGVRPVSLSGCLPDYVIATLGDALKDFDRKIKGFADYNALMTGVETRTSAPLRIVRKETMESENVDNFYPIGEGAGYAGGIISAAVDGIKLAEKIIESFKSK